MIKNERIEIAPLQNGYKVSYNYREMVDPAAQDRYDRWEYVDKEYMFASWDEVVTFIRETKLEVPPAKLN